ncbi:MAG: ATP-binding cassette domain-containing protein [Ignavibacteriales bacterium]|nr:ATP-binding cassette domain-containing protein [Ignavibacteriales bacterium]
MQNLRALKPYFKRYRGTLLAGVVYILLSNGFTVYMPLAIRDAFNELQTEITDEAILRYALIIVGAAALGGFFRYHIRQTIIRVSRKIEYDLRQDLWEHIQRLPLRFFNVNSVGDIMARCTNDVSAVRMFVGPAVMYSLDTLARLAIVVAIMISIDAAVTLYALLPLPILSYAVYAVGRRMHKRYTAVQDKFSELSTKAQENYAGMKTVKSYLAEDREIDEFSRLGEEYLRKNMRLARIQALFFPFLLLTSGVSIVVVVWAGGANVISGDLMIGDLTALTVYVGLLVWPVIALGWVVHIVQQGEAGMKRILRVFNEPIAIADDEKVDPTLTPTRGEIEFRDVTFKHSENAPPTLKNLSLAIPAGSTVAIMGKTGAGKSTLLDLIPRFAEPNEGAVLIDGRDVREYPLRALRGAVGFARQEAFLFSANVETNVAYALDEPDRERVERAAEIAQFAPDVADMTDGYRTMIGERGVTLSGGQKQRAAIARALLVDPLILLLDDSFSAVDTGTEEEILKGLRRFMKDRTSVIVCHRVSTAKEADFVVVIEDGKVAERGTHDELIARDGWYAEINRRQTLEKEIEELD